MRAKSMYLLITNCVIRPITTHSTPPLLHKECKSAVATDSELSVVNRNHYGTYLTVHFREMAISLSH